MPPHYIDKSARTAYTVQYITATETYREKIKKETGHP